jgi:O-Antigen ligase
MANGVAIEVGAQRSAPAGMHATEESRAWSLGELGTIALMLLPGALIVLMGLNAGGYFPGTPAVAVVVVTQIVLVRILQARNPFEGVAPIALVAIAALAGYAAWTLASALWSHSTGRALVEFDRAWLYLLVLVLFATIRASEANVRWLIRGLAVGGAIVCVAGLTTRVLPDVWHTAPDVANQRLSYPVTYWNTLGLLATLTIVLALQLTCDGGERRAVRVVAAAIVPLLAATLFFTFSRGSMVAGAIGLTVYVLVARPRLLLSGLAASVPASAVMIVAAYRANLLDTLDPTTPAAVAQGHHVAFVAGACVLASAAIRLTLALKLDARMRSPLALSRIGARARRGALAGGAIAALAIVLALGVGQAVARDWDRFMSGASVQPAGGDLRTRLSDPSNNGRTDLWNVALRAFSASPAHGVGAGAYQTAWDRGRPHYAYTVNTHSLYLQAMAELGLPGVLLLAVLVGSIVFGIAARSRGPRRALCGTLLATAIVCVLHAGVDWDWEMPVVMLGLFAAGGLALSLRSGEGPGWAPAHNTRIVLALLCLLTLALPVSLIGSQSRLGSAERALYASNCAAATPAALSSIGWLDVRPEPYEVVGFCDLRRGLPRLAVAAMRAAVSHDPRSWETHYALAIAQASAGIDPRASVATALRMDPLEPLTRQAARQLRSSNPTEWVKRAASVRAAALSSSHLSIVPS